MQFISDGKRIVSGSPDSTISIFDISSKSKKPIQTKKEHTGKIHCVSLTSDEKIMMSSGSESEILLWDLQNFKVMYK
jgi:WD40 repeat protein